MTVKVTFTYPRPDTPRYSTQYEQAALEFTELLWTPGRLPEIADSGFVEVDSNGEVTLRGVQELQAYRRRFGDLTLVSLEMVAVPPDMAMDIPGTDDDGFGGLPFDLDMFFEAVFRLPVDGVELPPGSPVFPKGTPPALIAIRMREPHRYRDGINPVTKQPKLMVVARTYNPAGEVAMLEPGGQHSFVVRQLWHYWYSLRRNRQPASMVEAAIMRPLVEIMHDELPRAF